MASNYESFDEWYAHLLKRAKERHWNAENPDEWRKYYQCHFTPEYALKTEIGASDDTKHSARY